MWVCFSGRDTQWYTHSWVRRYFCMTSWSDFKHPEDIYPICSQQSVYIFADCAHWLIKTVQISSNPSLICNFSYFSPSTIIPQTLHLAQGHWRDAPRSAPARAETFQARAETFQAIGAGTGRTSFCAGGTEGRAEWEDGDEIMGKMEGVMKTMNEDGDIVPTLSYPS